MARIAHFIQRYPPALGGSEAYFARLTEHLQLRGHTVTVWTTTAHELEELWHPNPERHAKDERTASGVRVRRFAPLSLPLRRYFLKAASFLPVRRWQLLAQPCNPLCFSMLHAARHDPEPVDLVHATAFPYGWPLVCAWHLARSWRVPLWLTPFLHLGDPSNPHDRTRKQYTSPHLRWLLRQADRVFVQTPSEQRAAVELGVPETRVVLQGLGVDPAECTGGNRERARRAWNLADDEVALGHLANLSEEKGSVDLLRAAELLQASGLKFKLILAGPEMPNFRAAWDRLQPRSALRLGRLSDEAKRDFYAGIDGFALPSRTDSFGLVLLEAWANGKPVVAYRAGGPADLVRSGVDGWLVACGAVAELAEVMDRVIRDEAMRRHRGDLGRARIAEEFRWADKLEIVAKFCESDASATANR